MKILLKNPLYNNKQKTTKFQKDIAFIFLNIGIAAKSTYAQSCAENKKDGKLDGEKSSVSGILAPTVSLKHFLTPSSCSFMHSIPPSATNTEKET